MKGKKNKQRQTENFPRTYGVSQLSPDRQHWPTVAVCTYVGRVPFVKSMLAYDNWIRFIAMYIIYIHTYVVVAMAIHVMSTGHVEQCCERISSMQGPGVVTARSILFPARRELL